MPLYEYRCKKCGHVFEKIKTHSEPEEKSCPVCQGEVEKMISAFAMKFKGSGFYSTDYPSRSASKSSDNNASESNVQSSAEHAKPKDTSSSGAAASPSASPATTSSPSTSTSSESSGSSAKKD